MRNDFTLEKAPIETARKKACWQQTLRLAKAEEKTATEQEEILAHAYALLKQHHANPAVLNAVLSLKEHYTKQKNTANAKASASAIYGWVHDNVVSPELLS